MPGATLLVLAVALVMSMVWAAAMVWAADTRRLDDFDETLPMDENAEGWDDKLSITEFQFVHNSDGDHYIRIMTDEDGSGLMGYERGFHLDKWPILEWEWKVTALPTGGDIRDEDANDQAGSMCIGYDPGFISFDKNICYIFENEGPIGTEGTSSTGDDTKFVILRAGDTDKLGEWYSESRNIYEDFKHLWGEEPVEEAAIGMFVDSDDTETSAEVYFRNIYLKKP